MSRHPIGDRAMSSSERQKRFLAKLTGAHPEPNLATDARGANPTDADPAAGAATPVKEAQARIVQSCHDSPAWMAPWLVGEIVKRRYGYAAAVRFRDEYSRAVEALRPPKSTVAPLAE
jgi:hypothetical protein